MNNNFNISFIIKCNVRLADFYKDFMFIFLDRFET